MACFTLSGRKGSFCRASKNALTVGHDPHRFANSLWFS